MKLSNMNDLPNTVAGPLSRRSLIKSSFIGSAAAMTSSLLPVFDAAEARAAVPTNPEIGPPVETTSGKIRGTMRNGVHTFRSVPYGATTAAPYRFMRPRKPEPWTGVKDVFMTGHVAQQLRPLSSPMAGAGDRANALGGDDCLTVNVFTPGLHDGKKRPVMFWIHGGGYTVGSGLGLEYDGNNLAAKHDVVVVCVNHRLNVFGYLYLGNKDERYADAGMVGMLDIVLALEWVRDNIANFGGDPGNVTIFGQSGGGGKTTTLQAMPPAKGLFHRAIVESGSMLRATTPDEAERTTTNVLKKLNVSADNLDKLQEFKPDEILIASLSAGPSDIRRATYRFGPVVDGRSLQRHPFDPDAPSVSADVPLLINTVETEGAYFTEDSFLNMDDAHMRDALSKRFAGSTDKVIETFRGLHPNAEPSELYFIITSFPMAAIQQAELKSAAGKAPVYLSRFTWRTPIEDGRRYSPHGVEMPFVFNNVWLCPEMVGTLPTLQPLADKVSAAWSNFARNGKPSAPGMPEWPAFDSKRRATMLINNEPKVEDDPGREGRELLLTLPKQPMF